MGEVNLLAPLLKMIEQERPEWECVISTTTTTGMALAKKKYPRQTVFYCPLDFSWAVKTAMRRVRPDVLVLAELELWPNLIRAAKRHGAKVAVINGRLGEKSFRGYRRIRPLVARLLRQIDLVAAQDETYAERFRSLGARPETVHVTGSMKYDGAQTDRNNPDDAALGRAGRLRGRRHRAAGRQHAGAGRGDGLGDVPRAEPAMAAVAAGAGAAPSRPLRGGGEAAGRFRHSVAAADGARWRARAGDGETGRRERERGRQSTAAPTSPRLPLSPLPLSPRVLLVDVVGELGAWWGTAQIAFVGGSMGSRGGQNMIEPAAYGAAVSFGPNTWNFRDIVAAMLAHDAAVVVDDGEQFTQFVRRCLEEPEYAAALGQRAQSFVQSQLGATQRTLGLSQR